MTAPLTRDEQARYQAGGRKLRDRLAEAAETRARLRDRAARNPHTVQATVPLLAALSHLTPGEREAWVDRNMVGRTLAAVADSMGISRSRVQQLEHHAAEKLAQRLDLDTLREAA